MSVAKHKVQLNHCRIAPLISATELSSCVSAKQANIPALGAAVNSDVIDATVAIGAAAGEAGGQLFTERVTRVVDIDSFALVR